MNLSAELFESIIGRLRGDKGRTAERRAAARVGLSAKIDLRIETAGVLGPFQSARVRDLSVGGISLLMPVRLPVGTTFIAYLPTGDGDPVRLKYKAVSLRSVGDQFIIGARFERKLGDELEEMRARVMQSHSA